MAYRSKFEETVIKNLKTKKIKFFYERERIKYVQPILHRSYLPDLYFPSTNVYVELKGRFTIADRKKHLWIRDSTDYDIRFCFQNSRVKIPKDWMIKNGKR